MGTYDYESETKHESTVLKICVYFAPTKMPSLSFVPFLTVLFGAISLVKCAPSSSICPHQPSSSTSSWHQVLKANQGQVGPSTTGDTHLSNLQDRLGELVEMITVRGEEPPGFYNSQTCLTRCKLFHQH